MAQMSSFVPATKTTIGIVDRLFASVGASDNLSAWEYTFMFEMTGTASIARNIFSKNIYIFKLIIF